MYGLIGSFKATPGKRSERVAILLGDVGAMPGCCSYIVGEDPTDSDTRWITETWDDAASHKASLGLPPVTEAIAKARPLLASVGEHRELNVIGAHGI